MELYFYLKAWLGYMDITMTDMLLFLLLGLLIVLGVYIAYKKDILWGSAQVLLTVMMPCMICGFVANNKEIWDWPNKMWIRQFVSHTDVNLSYVALLILLLFPTWIFVTGKNMSLLKK